MTVENRVGMYMGHDGFYLLLGLALRYICWKVAHLIPWYISHYVVHALHLPVTECVLLHNTGAWGSALPAHCPPGTRVLAIAYMFFDDSLQAERYFLPLLATISQLVTCTFLLALSRKYASRIKYDNGGISNSDRRSDDLKSCDDEGNTSSAWCGAALFYWLNPCSVLGAVLSPLPGLAHALLLAGVVLVAEPSSAEGGTGLRSLPLVVTASLLLVLQPDTLPLLLLFFALHTATSSGDSPSTSSFAVVATALLALGAAAECGYVTGDWMERLWEVLATSAGDAHTRHDYHPGFGILWYLHAQVFVKHAHYFDFFLQMQPYVYVVPLTSRLREHPVVAASIMLAISLLLCRRDACCADLVLVLACSATQSSVVAGMRHLPELLLLLLISCVGTPLMMLLWVQYGTGNANFVFFLCLGTCVAVVLGAVEFARAAMRLRKHKHTVTLASKS